MSGNLIPAERESKPKSKSKKKDRDEVEQGGETMQVDDDENTGDSTNLNLEPSVKKGKKKKKRKLAEAEAEAGEDATTSIAASERKKKKKRRLLDSEPAVGEEEDAPPPPEPETNSSSPTKEERKALRKEAKRAAAKLLEATSPSAPSPVPAPETTIAPADAKPTKQQRKAQKEARRRSNLAGEQQPSSSSSVEAIASAPVPSEEEVQAYLKKHNITITSPPSSTSTSSTPSFSTQNLTPSAYPSFAHLSLPPLLQKSFEGFKEPTPIQACCWPPALAGRDVVGVAETGSGKTLGFGVPALMRIIGKSGDGNAGKDGNGGNGNGKSSTVTTLVLAPTRELAVQTHDTLSELGAPFGIGSVALFGGVPKDPQRSLLLNLHHNNKHSHRPGSSRKTTTRIIVGTPGRVLDLMSEGVCDLGGVDYLVLDEADRMLDRGFENDIRSIVAATGREGRQTMMFSATWPEGVRRLAGTFQKDPVRVTVGSDDLTANSRVEQEVEVFDDPRSKDARLLSRLRQLSLLSKSASASPDSPDSRVLVFALYKKEAARVEQFLRRSGYSVGALHGDMAQGARMEALDAFKEGRTRVMVATDVAARGLDIPDVGAVVNYTFPLTIEDYIHRIGRTGRGGKTGKSITFFTGEGHERALAGELARVLREGGFDTGPLQVFPMTVKKKEHSVYGAFFRDDVPVPKGPTKIRF